jgi:hypothetical protein
VRVWSLFNALNATRTPHGFTVNALRGLEIEALARLLRVPFRPFEVDLIRALDDAFIVAVRERSNAPAAQPPARMSSDQIMGVFRRAAGQQNVSSRPMSMPLFDALFAG